MKKAGRFTQNKSFTSAKNMPLTQTLEGLRKYYIRISATPGLRGFVLKKLTSKFGIAVVLRLSTFLAGFAAAPFTAGLSTLISLASWGLTAYTLYEIYDYLFGEDNNGENMIKEYEALQAKEQNQSTLQKEMDSKGPTQLAGPEMPVPGTEGGEQQKQAVHPRTGRPYGGETTPKKYSGRFASLNKPSQISADSSNPQIEQILATIRDKESRGDYTAQNPNSSASGAYQYIDENLEKNDTKIWNWNRVCKSKRCSS